MNTPKKKPPVTLATFLYMTEPDGTRKLMTMADILDEHEAAGWPVKRMREELAIPPFDPKEAN